MTRICSASVGAFLFLIIFQNALISCTKTNTVTKTVTDTVTVVEKDTALTTTILAANSWKVLQIKGLVGNNYVDYVRGGSGNTIALDNEYITFNANGSGTYTDNLGHLTTFTWNFSDATNSTIIWNWNITAPATTVTWKNVVYHNASISYTEFYLLTGMNELASGTRIPK